jgi:hypothetical protein
MGTLAVNFPTLLDVARRLDPNGNIAKVAEIMNQTNEMLDDVPFFEGNMEEGHKTTIRGSIPVPTWRLANKGVQAVKSGTRQITEATGVLENYAQVDKLIADINGNSAAWRMSEEAPIIEGIGQSLASTFLYGDSTLTPERFTGLAPRYADLSGNTTSEQILDAGGSTNLSSIFLVGWSQNTVFGVYPKGSNAGLSMKDLGEVTVVESDGGMFQALRTHFQQKAGLVVRDYRFVVRIANIDMVALLTAGDASDTSANLLKLMARALELIPDGQNIKLSFYCNKTVRGMLRVKMMNKSNVYLTTEDMVAPNGITRRPGLHFQGIPIRRCDAITSAETRIVA